MPSRGRVLTLAILAAALAFRLALALGMPNDEPDDGRLYALLAHNVIAHGVYSANEDPPYSPTYIRVPGYPMFLAVIYRAFGDGNNTAVRIAQSVVDTGTCWIVSLLAAAWSPGGSSRGARDRARIVALGIAAACPFTAIYVATILTETLAMFLGTLTVLLATRALRPSRSGWLVARAPASAVSFGRWVLAGAAAGATALVRPEFILYAGAVGITLLIATAVQRWTPPHDDGERGSVGRVLPPGLALTLGVVLALAPWTIRNVRTMHVFEALNPRSVSMPGEFVAYGYADWVRTWIDHPRYVWPALWTVDLRPIHIEELPPYAFASEAERQRVAALLAAYNRPPPDAEPDEDGQLPPSGMTPSIDTAFEEIARARIAARPLHYYAWLPLKRAFMLWFDTHADFYPFSGFLFPLSALDRERQQQFWLPLFAALVGAWTLAGWAAAWRLARQPDTRIWVVLAAVTILPRLALLAWLENPEVRYTVEFFPIVSAMAAIALASRTTEMRRGVARTSGAG